MTQGENKPPDRVAPRTNLTHDLGRDTDDGAADPPSNGLQAKRLRHVPPCERHRTCSVTYLTAISSCSRSVSLERRLELRERLERRLRADALVLRDRLCRRDGRLVTVRGRDGPNFDRYNLSLEVTGILCRLGFLVRRESEAEQGNWSASRRERSSSFVELTRLGPSG